MDSPLCRACMGDEETASHVILHCPAVYEYRVKHLGRPRTLPEITDNIKGLLGFLGVGLAGVNPNPTHAKYVPAVEFRKSSPYD